MRDAFRRAQSALVGSRDGRLRPAVARAAAAGRRGVGGGGVRVARMEYMYYSTQHCMQSLRQQQTTTNGWWYGSDDKEVHKDRR